MASVSISCTFIMQLCFERQDRKETAWYSLELFVAVPAEEGIILYNTYFGRSSPLAFFPTSSFEPDLVVVPSPPLQKKKTKQQNCSSGLIRRIGTRQESWRNIQISQRGDEFGGICQPLGSEMNYAN